MENARALRRKRRMPRPQSQRKPNPTPNRPPSNMRMPSLRERPSLRQRPSPPQASRLPQNRQSPRRRQSPQNPRQRPAAATRSLPPSQSPATPDWPDLGAAASSSRADASRPLAIIAGIAQYPAEQAGLNNRRAQRFFERAGQRFAP